MRRQWQRGSLLRGESPLVTPWGLRWATRRLLMVAAPAQTPAEVAWGGVTTSPSSNAAFVWRAVKTGTLALVLFRLLRNLEKKWKKERETPFQLPARPWAWVWTWSATDPRRHFHDLLLWTRMDIKEMWRCTLVHSQLTPVHEKWPPLPGFPPPCLQDLLGWEWLLGLPSLYTWILRESGLFF